MTIRKLRRDDVDAAVALYLAVMSDQFLASAGAAFLRAYFRVWLESPAAIALVAAPSPDAPIAGILFGALFPAQHYRWMTRRGGGPIAARLLAHALRHPVWGAGLVRTRGARYVRGVLRMVVWTQRRRSVGAEASSGLCVGEVTHLMVAPRWRGDGVGRALLSQARDYAAVAGVERLTVVTPVGWVAEDFYERLGWINRGEMVSRSGEHFIRFELPLSEALVTSKRRSPAWA